MLATGILTIRASWLKPPRSAPPDQVTKNFSLYNKETVTLPPSGMMELSVSDSGAGMTEAQTAELFQDDVQFNVNNLQSGQGSGLGLFITKGIVDRHGGSLTVASEGLGKGATFTLTLPLYKRPKCETPTTTSTDVPDPQRPSTEQVERRPQHILVVDDCAVNRKLLIRLLTRAGHTCDGAEDGMVALHQVEAAMESGNYYATILLDNEMPVMNGPAAAKEMRKLGCDSLIVGVTGNLMREDVEYFKENGADEVMPKPFKMKDLICVWDESMGQIDRVYDGTDRTY
jgi:CheY-like chemotaxis protein